MRLLASMLLAGLAAAPVSAETVSPQCAGEEFRQLDFWVGTWDLAWEGGKGENIITREFNDCVIRENFADLSPATDGSLPFRGTSVSTYFAPAGLWRQTWVDNQGSYFALTGGPQADGTFVLTNARLSDSAPHLRMVFANITPDGLTWHWQASEDGVTWQDRWVITYTRRAAQ